MLRVVHGNRAELLLDQLIARAARAFPTPTPALVVGSATIRRWVTLRLARAQGIVLGLDTPSLEGYLARELTADAPARAAGLRALSRDQLHCALASVLVDVADGADPALGPIATYLAASAAPTDVRRMQLARRLASLWWDYARARPAWLDAWDRDQALDLGDDASAGHRADEAWQRRLHRRLTDALRARERAGGGVLAMPARLLAARARLALPPLPPGDDAHVLGVSYLAPSELHGLAALAEQRDITIYQLNPCAEFWEDLPMRRRGRHRLPSRTGSPAGAPAGDGPEPILLQLWGRPARDTMAALTEASAGDLQACFGDPSAPADEPATALGQLLADTAARVGAPARADGAARAAASGVRVLACPSPARELEIVAAEIAALLAADPTLMAPDIAVLVAGDRDAYLPLLPTIFDEVARVPHHVIGAAAAHAGRLAEALGRILALPGADFTRPELLGVMTHPHVIARYPHCSPDDWRDWVTTLGVYRGADARDHAGTYLEQAPDRYHWAQALDRLTLGAFLGPAEQGEADEVALGRHPLRPEPTTGDQQASAATFVALARSLIADARWLADHAATLTEWAAIFARTCDAYLTAATPDDDQDLARLHATLAELAAGDLDGRVLGFTEVRELLRERLGELRRDRGDVLIDGVTVATLAPMRALPWRHVFVVGLGGAAFPARSRPTPYDLRRGAALTARGDVTAADRDRHAMLEAVLGARASLTLSYVGTHPVSGEALEASAVVYELAEALAPYLGAATAAETLAAITTVHPMHRWSDRYADEPALASARPQAAIRERDAVATQAALARAITAAGADVSPDAAREIVRASPSGAAVRIGLLPPPPPALGRDRAPLATLRLRALTTFLESPVQAWARHVLGLRERDDAEALELAVEPLAVGAPARSGLLRDAFTRLLREPSMAVNDAWRAAAHGLIARGELPAGPFAEAARVRDVEILTQWLDATPRPAGAAPRCWGIGEGRADTTDLAPALRLDVPTPDGGVRRLALVGATELTLVPGDTLVIQQGHNASRRHLYHLRGALHHVIMAAAGLTPDREHTHHVLVGDGSTHAITHDPWSVAEAQAYLARLLGELFGEDHAYLLPLDVALGALGGRPAEALRHDHKEYGPVDSFDGLALPGPERQLELATRRLGPLVARARGWLGGAA
jgi:exodeoxyribonuclease V gamma subunit